MKNSSYYIAPIGDWTHDLPYTVASNMVDVSHALSHSATEPVSMKLITRYESADVEQNYNIIRLLNIELRISRTIKRASFNPT